MPQLRLERGVAVGEAGKLKPGPGRSAEEVASHQLGRIQTAMIELVAERGYDAVTLRELTGRAKVSSRSFYMHYAGKEECFLAVYGLVALKSLEKFSESEREADDADEAIRLAITRLAHDWGAAPSEVHLLLLAPSRASGPGGARFQQAELTFRGRLEESIANVVNGNTTFVPKAIVDGLTSVACSWLVDRGRPNLASQASELGSWAASLVDPAAVSLHDLDRELLYRSRRYPRTAQACDFVGAEVDLGSNSNFALLTTAVTRLLARDGEALLTQDEIADVAGISRSAFRVNFPDVESCVAAALSLRLTNAMPDVRSIARDGGEPVERVFQVVTTLCDQLTRDAAFSSFCRGNKISEMVLARLKLQRLLVSELRPLVLDATPDARFAELCIRASAGAFLNILRGHLRACRADEGLELSAHLTYLILAPVLGAPEAIDAMQQGRIVSAA